jgi:two-component system cell cycle sensor histidine kinase/response regulator CckA
MVTSNTMYAIDGPDKGKSFGLNDSITTIGRSSDNDICISDIGVSRRHAKLLRKRDKIFIVDLNSFHGVYVDGERIEPGVKVQLREDCTLHMGNTVLALQKDSAEKQLDRDFAPPKQKEPFDTSKSLLPKEGPKNSAGNLELLVRVSQIFAQSLNIKEVLREVIDQVFSHLKKIDRGAILLLDRERGTLKEVVSKTRMDGGEGLYAKINYSRSIVHRAIKEGKPVMMSDTSKLAKAELSDSIRQMHIRSIMGVPLKHKGKVLGIIYVDSIGLPGGFTKDDLRLLTGLSYAAAAAIENARLYEALKQELVGRQKAEKALIQSEERYRTLVEDSFDGILVQKQGKITFANRRLHEMLAYTNGELVGADHWTLYHPDFQDIARRRAQAGILGADLPTQYEVKLRRKDGSWFYAEINAQPVRFDGEPAEQVWVRDITERKQAVEALRESEEKYRLLVENANDAIFISQDDTITFPNPKTVDLLGYSADELNRISFVDLIHPEDKTMVLENYLGKLEGKDSPSTYSFRIIYRAGEELWVQLNAVPITWEGRPAVLNFLRDVTPEKKLEAHLLEAQKMEAIGTLAGGTAHEFNNLLMCVQGNASLMLLDIDSNHPHYKRLKNIEKSVQSGAEFTEQLLGFAMGGKYEVRTTDLNEIIETTSTMFGRTKKDIRIYQEYQEDIWPVELDQGQIKQALLNLYVNAGQAMPGGGELRVQTKNVTLDESFVEPYQVTPGKYVRISITDTGVGMDEITQRRIFDPFFTTKDMGRGTGLGLASVYGIIKNHGGIIRVSSKKGKGTTFTIFLPASVKQVVQEKQVSEDSVQGKGTVLLVDDEDMIIDVAEEFLHKLGYKVLVARGGQDAREVYASHADEIDLVILDMTMKDMGGGETYDKIKEINPNAKVLLSSGYAIEGKPAEILERGCNGFIQKPFTIGELARIISEILQKE